MKTVYTFEDDRQFGAVEAKLRADDSLIVEYFPRQQGEMFGRKVRFDGTGLLAEIATGKDSDDVISRFIAIDAAYRTPDRVIKRGTEVE